MAGLSDSRTVGTYDLIANGTRHVNVLNTATSAVSALTASGGTNYPARRPPARISEPPRSAPAGLARRPAFLVERVERDGQLFQRDEQIVHLSF